MSNPNQVAHASIANGTVRALIILGACAPLLACATAPKDVVLAPTSPEALVVLEVVSDGMPATANYVVEAGAFDAGQSRIEGSGYISLPVSPRQGAPAARYAIALAKPGTYVLTAVSHKTTWYSCFNGGTSAFTVEPGTVTFLGRLDARPALRDIATKLPSYSTNSQRYYVLDTPRPALTAPADLPSWNAEVTAYVHETFPQVSAPIRGVELRPATFASGWSLLGQKVCYGYFNRARGEKTPAKTP